MSFFFFGYNIVVCTANTPTDDYLCTDCEKNKVVPSQFTFLQKKNCKMLTVILFFFLMPVGRKCVEATGPVPIPDTADKEFPCPNYEKILNQDGTFAGFGESYFFL